jgi:hypothetical protein
MRLSVIRLLCLSGLKGYIDINSNVSQVSLYEPKNNHRIRNCHLTVTDICLRIGRPIKLLETSLEINHHMNASNDKLLFDAAKIGNLKKVEDLLSKGARTGFIN